GDEGGVAGAGDLHGVGGEVASALQVHPKEKTLAKQLAEQSNGKYTQAQIEDALRAANNNALGEDVTTGMIVGGATHGQINPTQAYDQGASWSVNSINGVALNLVQNISSQVDSGLAAYIQGSTGNTYSWNDSTLGKAPTNIVKPNTSPFAQGWNTGNHSAGLTPDTTPEQRQENLVKFTDTASTGTGLAAIWTPPPIDLALTAISAALKATNYLLRPPSNGTVLYETSTIAASYLLPQTQIFQTGIGLGFTFMQPLVTPMLDNFSNQPTTCTPPRKC
ncbi:hypothetical protein QN374_17240, partial [Herbaspirillum sp. RTI4]|uniref:hypothetical protein n=1 Tax=Herbaspirillum sp. RTI4 TaxID=3048640 RepID=UPI002B37D8F0|nr:hypothetical protein [Herbaspirillum sp. RTI4]